MSNTALIETTSSDPVIRAIARRVVRILNDATLDRDKRVELVRKAQRDYQRHCVEQVQRQALQESAAARRLPSGYKPQSVVVADGKVQIGAINRSHGFTWFEGGDAPAGVVSNQPVLTVNKSTDGGKKVRQDPIAERRKALQTRKV